MKRVTKEICGIFLSGLISSSALLAQNYRAIHGSSMAGGLGAANNPSSILHVPFSWDITLFALQEVHTSNAFYVKDYSLLAPNSKATIEGFNQTGKWFALANQDLHLLNARIRLDERRAIAFGLNLRSNLHAGTSRLTFRDTASELRQVMHVNRDNVPLSGEALGSAWAELYGTYAVNIFDRERSILNAGLTLSVTRGLAGGFLNLQDIGFSAITANGATAYELNDFSLAYGYSANIDAADAAPGGGKRSAFLRQTRSSLSLSAGVEFIVPVVKTGDESNGYHYDWKLGLSVLDLGFNSYPYSKNSRSFFLNGGSLVDSTLEGRFDGIGSIEQLNDTMAALAGSSAVLAGKFTVYLPARMVLNIDKNLIGNFFINGELSFPFAAIADRRYLLARDLNLAAITPRFENRLFGAYLPVTMNSKGQIWMGGAVKAGPLLLGLHNWANLFSGDKIQKGGFYLALTLRPGKTKDQSLRERNPRLPKSRRRQLECPGF